MNTILLSASELDDSGLVRLDDQRSRHMLEVLGVECGQKVRVGLLDGPLGEALVERIDRSTVELRCQFEKVTPARQRVDLLLALPRPKVIKRLWSILAGLGVGRIILTNAWKVERNYFDTHWLQPKIYRPLLIEGLQQAIDTRVPDVSVHKRLKVLVEDELDALSSDSLRLVADPIGAMKISSAVGDGTQRVLLAVGPEGGWIEPEIDLLKRHSFEVVSTGARLLRSDVACMSLLTLLHDALE